MSTLKKKVVPIGKWILSGGIAIIVDLALLYILVEFFGVYYLIAASMAFLTSASTNYAISGLAIFKNAQHSIPRSYITFMGISFIGLGVITISLYILVDIFHVHYLLARFFLAGTIGVSSFFLHKYFSFKDTSL
jgi:putative flippase GtrA